MPAEWLPASRTARRRNLVFILNTGRPSSTGNTVDDEALSALDAISPKATVFLHPGDCERLGIADGEFARVTSRRGSIELEARVSHRETSGSCFIPFHFREAAANLLTIDEIDPVGKIPEFKFCAVRVGPARTPPPFAESELMALTNGRIPGREARAGRFPGPSLIPSLNAIQREHGWLPASGWVTLSRETRRPLYEIEGLISFYPHFRADPPPRVEVTVCHDLSCWLHGAEERIAEIRQRYGDDVEIEVRGLLPGTLRHRTGGRGRRSSPAAVGRAPGSGRARTRRARSSAPAPPYARQAMAQRSYVDARPRPAIALCARR